MIPGIQGSCSDAAGGEGTSVTLGSPQGGFAAGQRGQGILLPLGMPIPSWWDVLRPLDGVWDGLTAEQQRFGVSLGGRNSLIPAVSHCSSGDKPACDSQSPDSWAEQASSSPHSRPFPGVPRSSHLHQDTGE